MKDKMTAIKKWSDHCNANHGNQCMPQAKQIPHRLIEVRGNGSPPRLVLGKQLSVQNQQYTTLSHCWGTSLPMRTLLSNLESYSDQIPPPMIPRTFDDAILITQALGVRYIWIDALCIVQDDTKEWEQEAAKMKDIYSGSILNIAASDSSGSEGGCFPVKNSLVQTFHLAQVEEGPELLIRIQPGDTRHLTKHTVLSSRGWVLQEQLLPHRIISCMSDEMHWECSEAYETETGVHFDSYVSDTRGVPRMYQCPASLQQDGLWRSWMVNFSERDFSFWKDRLPALSGIVGKYQEITGDVSILGLWKHSIIQDLLWIRTGQISLEPALEIGSASLPSWSWLSCPSHIEFDIWQLTMRVRQTDRYVLVQDHCELINFSVEWNGLPFISTVKLAYIVLYGPTVEATIDIEEILERSNPPSFKLTYSKHISCTGQFDRGSVAPGRYHCLLLRSRVHSQTNARRDIFMILQTHCGSRYKRVGIACVYETALFAEATRKKLLIY